MVKNKRGLTMSLTLQIILICVSFITLLYMCFKIRKSQMNIEDTLFWALFTAWLLLIAIFPQIPYFFSEVIGIESPVNFLFLSIIFIVFIKLFYMTIKISKLENKIKQLAQYIALTETDLKNNHKGNKS